MSKTKKSTKSTVKPRTKRKKAGVKRKIAWGRERYTPLKVQGGWYCAREDGSGSCGELHTILADCQGWCDDLNAKGVLV